MENDYLEDFARMALELHDVSVEESVDVVVEYALKAVGCGYAGVVFVHGRKRVETAAATDPVVTAVDEAQVELGEGPHMDVVNGRYSVLVSDTLTDPRWPKWGTTVAGAGLRSLLSVRLYTSSTTVGALNLYDGAPDKFDISDQEVAHVLARHAAVAMASARRTENLWQAIDSRKRIGQAQGILMERFGLTEDQAFSVLTRYSQDKNVKLRQVAETVVKTRDLPS